MNDEKATIGVVIPTRNSAKTLEATLASLFSQRSVRPRIVAVDSESDDGTLDILREWEIETLDVPAGNMYRAVNAGIRVLDSLWVTWLNSDDLLFPGALERLVASGERSGAPVIYGDCDYCDEEGRFLFCFSSAKPEHLLPLSALGILGFGQPAAIFRRELWQSLGGLREEFRFASDLDFFLRALHRGASFQRLSGPPVAVFRIHDGQLSKLRYEQMEAEKRSIASTAGSRWPSAVLALWRWRLQNARSYCIRALRKRAIQS